MTLLSDVIADARSYLLGDYREETNKLASNIAINATTVPLSYSTAGVKQGAVISIDLEDFYVWASTDSPTPSATVQPAQRGSISTSHTGGALVLVNPKFTDYQIVRAVNAELDDLSSPTNGLFQMKTVTVAYNSAVVGYDLTSATDVISLYRLYARPPGVSKDWVPLNEAALDRNALTTDFASGFGVILGDLGYPGQNIRLLYKAPFAHLTTIADDVAAVSGLHSQAHDLLAIGAAIRLVEGREIQRNFTEAQTPPRRAAEVPPGASLNAIAGLRQLRTDRIRAEATRLAVAYPPVVR